MDGITHCRFPTSFCGHYVIESNGSMYYERDGDIFNANLIFYRYNTYTKAYFTENISVSGSILTEKTPDLSGVKPNNSESFVGGNTPDFVRTWLKIILVNSSSPEIDKDWNLVQNTPRNAASNTGATILSFTHNRVTKQPIQGFSRAYREVTSQVKMHCIGQQLTLPGFYAFLRDMNQLRNLQHFGIAIESDFRLKTGFNNLIIGYWNLVRPSVTDFALGASNSMHADAQAIAGIQHEMKRLDSGGKQDQLQAKLPFKERIQNELSHALESRPMSSPTLCR